MGTHFPIRPASFADAAAMAAIERQCFSDPWPLEGFREVLSMPGAVGLVMTNRDEPIGYFLAREIFGTAEVLNLAVVPEYRGRGLGATLLDAVDAWRRQRLVTGDKIPKLATARIAALDTLTARNDVPHLPVELRDVPRVVRTPRVRGGGQGSRVSVVAAGR